MRDDTRTWSAEAREDTSRAYSVDFRQICHTSDSQLWRVVKCDMFSKNMAASPNMENAQWY